MLRWNRWMLEVISFLIYTLSLFFFILFLLAVLTSMTLWKDQLFTTTNIISHSQDSRIAMGSVGIQLPKEKFISCSHSDFPTCTSYLELLRCNLRGPWHNSNIVWFMSNEIQNWKVLLFLQAQKYQHRLLPGESHSIAISYAITRRKHPLFHLVICIPSC